jgi:hypothetical protein
MNLNGCYTFNGSVNSERDVKDARLKNKSRRPRFPYRRGKAK